MDPTWLKRRLTVQEVETEHAVRDDRLGPNPVPFGFINERWQALLARMQPGDELWEFSSPAETWQHLCGRAGIALVRGGNVVDSIITCMN